MIMNVRVRHKRALYRAGVALLAASLATLGLGVVPAAAQTLPETPTASPPEAPGLGGQEPTIGDDLASGASVCSGITDPLSPPPVSVFVADGEGLRDCATAMGGTESPGASQGDPREEHAQFLRQYGDIGCTVVPGFNDRCPSTVSEPYDPDSGGDVLPGRLASSPDGSMLYATAIGPDWRMVIVAYHTTPDEPSKDGSIAWSRSFGEEGKLTGAFGTAMSPDGERLYAIGVARDLSDDSARDDWVAAFDTTDGALVWQRSVRELVGGEPDWVSAPSYIVLSPDGRQLVFSAGAVYEEPGGLPAAVYTRESWHFGLNAVSGELDWKATYTAQPNLPGWFGESLAYSPDGSRLFVQVIVTDSPAAAVKDVTPIGGRTRGIGTLAYDTATGSLIWDETYTFPAEDGSQNPPAGLAVSPDGKRVFAAGTHYFTDRLLPGPSTGIVVPETTVTGSFLALAYDAGDGALLRRLWRKAVQKECHNNWPYMLTFGRSLALSPSGDFLYIVGRDGNDSGGCTDDVPSVGVVRGARVFGWNVSTGSAIWDTIRGGVMDGAGRSCFPVFGQCDITVVPGPTGGDAGSHVVVTTEFEPHGGSGVYSLTAAFDGMGPGGGFSDLLWQGRYLDTYNDGGTSVWLFDAPVLSPDASRLNILFGEWSKTRKWPQSMLVMAYDM